MSDNTNRTQPTLLDAAALQEFGFSRPMAYKLFNRKDFPTVRIGKRVFVRRDRFLDWLDKQTEVQV